MKPNPRLVLLAVFLALSTLTSCQEEVTPPRAQHVEAPDIPEASSANRAHVQRSPPTWDERVEHIRALRDHIGRSTRWDARSWYESHAGLAADIARANGEAMIGFKRPSAVSARRPNRVPLSPGVVQQGKRVLVENGVEILQDIAGLPAVLVHMAPDPALIEHLRNNPWIDNIEANTQGRWLSGGVVSDPPSGSRELSVATPPSGPIPWWNIRHIQASDVWDQTEGQGAKVALLDNAIDRDLSIFNIANQAEPCDSVNETFHDHGVAVGSIIAAQDNGVDIKGAAPDVQFYAIDIGNPMGPIPSEVICGLQYAIEHDVDVATMSIGTDSSTYVDDKIEDAYEAGVLLVAAVGNEDGPLVHYPARHSDVIGVTAVDSLNERWDAGGSGSNYGPGVELAAPGVHVVVYDQGSDTLSWRTATSFATPHVAAAAALVKSEFPTLTNVEIRAALDSSALNLGSSTYYGYGLVQVQDAFDYVTPPPPLGVTVYGNQWITQAGTYWFHTDVENASGSVFYQWYIDQGYGWEFYQFGSWPWSYSDVSLYIDGSSPSYMKLKVEIWDDVSYATDEISIYNHT